MTTEVTPGPAPESSPVTKNFYQITFRSGRDGLVPNFTHTSREQLRQLARDLGIKRIGRNRVDTIRNILNSVEFARQLVCRFELVHNDPKK